MEREIKFRGLRSDGKGWAYGYYYEYSGKHIISYQCHSDNCTTDHWHEVTPSSVGQFTGLTDKNGKEIYEGGVVVVRGTKKVGLYEDEVIYEYSGFILKNNKTYMKDSRSLISVQEVIGNIHEK